jgi:hypothetical protein
MRRSVPLLACVILLLGVVMLPALSRGDFDRVVDFSVTLKTLAAAAEGKAPLPTGKMLLLSGTVSDVNILNKDEQGFKVRIELIAGEWIGLEDVKAYACYVEFNGPEYFKVFPARAPRTATPDVITLNSRVMVVCSPLDIVNTPQGEKHVRASGAYIRIIE